MINDNPNARTEDASDDDCCEASAGVDMDLLLACDSTTTEENESFSWSERTCTRDFDIVITYSLPSDEDTIINTNTESSFELASADDCCDASEMGTNVDLLQACDSVTTQNNEEFAWEVDSGICTRSFEFMTIYSLPSDDSETIKVEIGSESENATADDCCEASQGTDPDLF